MKINKGIYILGTSIIVIMSLLCLFVGCNLFKENDVNPNYKSPDIMTTTPITQITYCSALCSGTLNSGVSNVLGQGFYLTTEGLFTFSTNYFELKGVSAVSAGSYSLTLTGLMANNKYSVNAYARTFYTQGKWEYSTIYNFVT